MISAILLRDHPGTAIVTGLGETSTEKTKYYGSKSIKFSIKKGTISWH